MRNLAVLLIAMLIGSTLVGATLVAPARASSVTTVTYTDSSVDVKKNVPSWKDIVSESVSAGPTGNFSFSLNAAASIPLPPPISKGIDQLEWWFCLNVNTTFAVGGWPQSNGTDNSHDPCQYFVILFWDGTNYASVVADRNPMLTGSLPRLTTVSFALQGATVSWSVAPSLIGSPHSFGFEAATEDRGSAIVQIVSPTDVVVLGGNDGYLIWDADGFANGVLVAHWP